MKTYYELHIPIDPSDDTRRTEVLRQIFLERFGGYVVDPAFLLREELAPDRSVVETHLRRYLVPAPDDTTARFLAAEVARICDVDEVTMFLPQRPVERVPRSRWATLWRADAR